MSYDEMEHGYHGPSFGGAMRIVGMVIGGLCLAAFFGFVFGYFIMWLWNWLMPGLFGFKVITFWQAVGICILGKLIFGSGHYGHRHHNKDWHGRKWRKHMHLHDDWAPNGDYSNWRYYDDYWKTEGKTAYEAYLNRIKQQPGSGDKV